MHARLEETRRATLSVVAVACFLFALSSIALAFPFFWTQNKVVRTWPETTAVVRNSEVVEVTIGGEKLWSTRFDLSYDLGDHIVQTTVNGYRQGVKYSDVFQAALRFPTGASVIIRYNPSNPSQVRLDTDNPRRYYQIPIALATTGAVFFAISLVIFFVARS